MSNVGRVWIVDDEHSVRWVLEQALKRERLPCSVFDSAIAALKQLERERPALVISDVRMADTDGIDLLKLLKERLPELPVILMTAYAGLDRAVSAFGAGALEFIPKPFDIDQVVALVRRSLGTNGAASTQAATASSAPAHGLLGDSPAMQELYRGIARLARTDIGVLIIGESGTGKELVARALHYHGHRQDKPFIAINTAAIPRDLLGSELFGHERGAFTGAASMRSGRFEQADTGSLFLDEIGDMALELQAPLLRVLAEGEFYRVGGSTPIRTDVRLITASHRNLEALIHQGLFREDLYYRLNVACLRVPPLHERGDDLSLLARHFLQEAIRRNNLEPCVLSSQALEKLTALKWPGNVRQLENFCQWAAVMCAGREIHPDDLPGTLGVPTGSTNDWTDGLLRWAEAELAAGRTDLLPAATVRLEKVLLRAALGHAGGNRRKAARLVGLGRNTLARKADALGLGTTAPDDDRPPPRNQGKIT